LILALTSRALSPLNNPQITSDESTVLCSTLSVLEVPRPKLSVVTDRMTVGSEDNIGYPSAIISRPTTSTIHQFWDALDSGDVIAVSRALTEGHVSPAEIKSIPNDDGLQADRPLHRAAKMGHADVVKLLLNNGIPVDAVDGNGETALHYAAWFGSLPCTITLVESGASVNFRSTKFTSTPLVWACQRGRSEIIEYLLSQGASVDVKSGTGDSPLIMATHTGHYQAVEVLIRNGANPNIAGDDGYTALHWAAKRGYKEIATLLLSKNAQINAQTQQNALTPLHVAASVGQTEIVSILLQNGADARLIALEKTDEEIVTKRTAADKAAQNGFDDLARLIREWVARDGEFQLKNQLRKFLHMKIG
jgi:ankyrin repeat protein